ncbi:hypothetical protein HRI_001315800 [Hibiscus trionum]|uniref:Endonuclease/exonuclease/phosphatase domain-containing protein n=1 Tax=Hibiscus trionum TaxID=183268 RepID=A0A9W7HII3_HIBTR|nr:hypothetical protein HRI_001315800 [Hibiscus trionum]
MKIISWNVRGLGKSRTVGRLKQRLRDENLVIIFLIETKLSSEKMARVRSRLGFQNGIDVAAIGRSGGLSIGWKHSCLVNLQSFSARHIDVIIEDDSEGRKWRLTGFYGAPEEQYRADSWNLLRSLNQNNTLP